MKTCLSASLALGLWTPPTVPCFLLWCCAPHALDQARYWLSCLSSPGFDVRFSFLLPLGIVLLEIEVASLSTYRCSGLQNGAVNEYFHLLSSLHSKRLTSISYWMCPKLIESLFAGYVWLIIFSVLEHGTIRKFLKSVSLIIRSDKLFHLECFDK